MTRIHRAVLHAVAAVLLSSSASLAQDAGQTVLGVCTKCHTTKRICRNLGKRDAAWWTAKVGLMLKRGAALNPQGKETVVAYLSGRKPGDRPVCE